MTATTHDALEQSLELTTRMLEAAGRGDWDDVVGFDIERSELLAQGHPADARSRELLMSLVEKNRELEVIAGRARDQVDQQMGDNRQRHRAASAYLASARG
jgi:hypothetical protein